MLRLAHSPDADDAFMFYPLLKGKIDRGALEIEEVCEDIETLNRKALEGVYEISAVSLHVYPSIADRYLLLSTGACFGDRYGPVIVASKALKPKQLLRVRMGVPGKHTTAFLVLKLYEAHLAGEGKSGICYSEVAFDQIMDQIIAGKLDAGLLIHEGQLTATDKGLHKIVDLGEWWHKQTSLPLPLGGIVIRRDLAPSLQKEAAVLIQSSIRYALEHKEEALAEALPFARGLDPERAAKFIEMYVNEMTVEFGRKGIRAIKTLFDLAVRQGILDQSIDLEECLLDLRHGRIPEEAGGKTSSAALPVSAAPCGVLPSTPQSGLGGRLASEALPPASEDLISPTGSETATPESTEPPTPQAENPPVDLTDATEKIPPEEETPSS